MERIESGEKLMKCIAYVRVSSKEQDETVQIAAIREYCTRNGYELVKLFIEKGVSGARPFLQREAARQLLNYIEENNVDAIIVFSLDRLGRNMLDSINTLKMLEEKNVKVISIKEEFLQTLDENIRKLIVSILLWVAEYERKRIRERQEAAWRAGKRKGRPPKVNPSVIEKYLKRYKNLSLKAILKIMRSDGYEISYATLRRWVKRLNNR